MRWAAEPRLLLYAVLNPGCTNRGAGGSPRPSLLVGVPYKPEGREPLVTFIVVGTNPFDSLLLTIRQTESEAQRHVLTKVDRAPGGHGRIVIGMEEPVNQNFPGQGNHCLDPPLSDVLQRFAAGDRLPNFYRTIDRTGNQGNILHLISPVRNIRRNGIVFTLVGKRLFIKGLLDNLHLFFEELSIGVIVNHRRPESLHLTGVVTSSHTENQTAASQDVGHGKVFRQAERMPHGNNVESGAKLELPGNSGQVNTQQC